MTARLLSAWPGHAQSACVGHFAALGTEFRNAACSSMSCFVEMCFGCCAAVVHLAAAPGARDACGGASACTPQGIATCLVSVPYWHTPGDSVQLTSRALSCTRTKCAPPVRGPALRLAYAYSALPHGLPTCSRSSYCTVACTSDWIHEMPTCAGCLCGLQRCHLPGHRRLQGPVTLRVLLALQASRLRVITAYTSF